jgi:uncharacterized protein
MLWNGGISFSGVTAFIFADLIILPILVIYRKYYGTKMMLAIAGIFYATMVLAAYVVEFAFGRLRLISATRATKVTATAISWDCTTVLNIIFLLLGVALLVRFFRTGGGLMLKMMGGSPAGPAHFQPTGPDSTCPATSAPRCRSAQESARNKQRPPALRWRIPAPHR